jgi:hypothetical protein
VTPEEEDDIRRAVSYHREHGGYEQHNSGGRSCFCGGCRVVRLFELQAPMLQALRYIARPTMGLQGETDLRDFTLHHAKDELVRLALATCIEVAQRALDGTLQPEAADPVMVKLLEARKRGLTVWIDNDCISADDGDEVVLDAHPSEIVEALLAYLGLTWESV